MLKVGDRCQVLPAYRMGPQGQPGGRTGHDPVSGREVFVVSVSGDYVNVEDRLCNVWNLHKGRLKVTK